MAFVNIDGSFFRPWITLALDWDRYKQRCDTPDVFSRWMLMQTGELLSHGLRQPLLQTVSGDPILKPLDHTGGDLTDMFAIAISLKEARTIYDRVLAAVAAGETTSDTRSRGLGGFAEAWREYVAHLDSEHADVHAGTH